jgi:hypothetical protein
MKKIETSGGLEQEWPTPNSWEKGERKKKKIITLNLLLLLLLY